jgi:hypothetical protein
MKKKLLTVLWIALSIGLAGQSGVDTIFYEDFNGGLGQFTSDAGNPVGAVWQWTESASADSALVNGVKVNALFYGNFGKLIAPSSSNGAAQFNSDVYDSGGKAVGQGTYIGNHTSHLVSGPINCTGYNTVNLSFYQLARANAPQPSTLVSVSNDGGITWVNFPINEKVVSNGSSLNGELILLDISQVAGGKQDVRIRFTWNGRYYFWLIDDVALITSPGNNLAMGNYFYPPLSFATPESQIATDTFGFSANISNKGGETQFDVTLKARILDEELNLIWEDSVIIDQLNPGEDTLMIIDTVFVPNELEMGLYYITYEVYTPGGADFNPFDNFNSEIFVVTDKTFSKENGARGGVRTGADYWVANMYTMSPASANNFMATKINFAAGRSSVDGPITGNQVTIFLYKFKSRVLPDFSNFNINSKGLDDDLEIVGFAEYTFPANYQNYSIIDVDLLNLNAEPGVPLEPGGRYLATVNFEGASNKIYAGTNGDINYFQISTVVYADGRWFLGGFGPETSGVIRMLLDLNTPLNFVELPKSNVKLFPNPTSDHVLIELNFEKPQQGMVIIADYQGRILKIREFRQLQQGVMEINTQDLPNGMYFVRISTEEGMRTEKLVVTK